MLNPIDCLSVKIVLLNLLNNLPEQPSINLSSQYITTQESQPSRTLEFKHEISITQQLSFICAYSNDPLHVLATCVEEGFPRSCLIIRLAANTGRHEALVDGLKAISRILQNEAIDVNRSTNSETLFKAVVALNHKRILSRIRSRHAPAWKAKGKSSLIHRLRTAKELLRNSSICSTRAHSLTRDVDNLQKQFGRLEDMDPLEAQSSMSEEHILGLVKSIHFILLHYEQDLKLVPYTPGLWSGNATESLLDRLGKISQYVKACEELLKAARRYIIFSAIAVEFVDLQQNGRRLSVNTASDLDKIIEASCKAKTLSRVSGHLGHKSISNTRESIKARLSETSRLHAEIQLVLYYEMEADHLRPRVICSNKSACYLCYLFLQLHGQYYIPSTHGRLYDTWKWPVPTQSSNTNGVQRLLPQFNSVIDRKIQDNLNKARVGGQTGPLESRVDLLAAITPSIQSDVSRQSRSICSGTNQYQKLEGNSAATDNDNVDDDSSNTSTKTARELPPLSLTQTPPLPRVGTPMANPAADANDSTSSSLFLRGSALDVASHGIRTSQEFSETQRELLCLQKGQAASHSFNMENCSLQVHIPGLHVGLQYDASSANASRLEGQILQAQGKCLQMEIECLSSSLHCSENDLTHVVDLEEGDWVEKSCLEGVLFSAEGLLLRQRSTLLRLRARAV
ncbi:hypothetical protein V8E54_002109 [Elaphomyces granulatus]